ncbi:MAG: hypothetical protein IJO65_01225 [Lachnospiraceae bacterium]|nr:hypothetical protein [Lachnospiraceae bacterium]
MILSKYKRAFKIITYCLVNILMCLPSIIITLYTYPVQDDFYNTTVILAEIAQGKNAFCAAWSKAINGYTTYSGYYFSLFLTYFTDAIVQCDVWGIRIVQFVMSICFYLVVCWFIYSVTKKVMLYSTECAWQVTSFFVVCITCLYYYSEHEDFYWFCASVIYLIPIICIMLGSILLIYAITYNSRILLIPVVLLGFLSGGSVLNIAALGCILFVMIAYWGIVVKKRIMISLVGSIPMVLGGIINVVAPGNFVRKGSAISGDEVFAVLKGTFQYTIERYELFLTKFPLFPAILIILFLLLLHTDCSKYKYKFYVPILFTTVNFLSIMIIIFPVALGYGMDVYVLMERSNFISDFAIYFFAFLTLFYWRGWLAVKYPKMVIKGRAMIVMYIAIIGISCLVFMKIDIREIVPIRLARELISGRIKNYAEWNVSIIEEMKNGEGDIVKIETSDLEDKTCLINPKFYYGEYNYEEEFANRSMAKFFGKKAIYIYDIKEE